MRLLKLSLVFLAAATIFVVPLAAQSAAAPVPNGNVQIAPAPPAQTPFTYAQNGREITRFDRGIRLPLNGNPVCMKLRKYIFHRSDGGDAMQPIGETDCTYTSKVWPKSADDGKPLRPQFGLQSAVARSK